MKETTENTQSKKREKWFKWIIIFLWLSVILGTLFGFYTFYSLSKGDLPSFEQLENPQYDLASVIYDANGESFGKYYVENREPITFAELSPNIRTALLATEDERFYNHSGVDLEALARVITKTILLSRGESGGGSTITQQLAKLLFDRPNLSGKSSIGRAIALVKVKLKEWITAVRLEKSYTKEEIMTMYLNKFEFINGAHGIQAAAETYFGKRQDALDIEEAAVLVGMLKNPSLYNPKRFPEKAKLRRNVVLHQMKKSGELDVGAYDSLKIKDIDMSNFLRSTQSEGPAPYFRAELTKWIRDLFEKESIRKPDGSKYNVYTDGLKIHTTIDLNYQKHAEAAVKEHMKWNQKRYWNVWKGMNPWTFEADDAQLAIRMDILQRRLKGSERYLDMREKYLGATIDKLRDKYEDLPLSDNVIKALVSIKDGKSSFANEINKDKIDKKYRSQYEDLINIKGWKTLRADWDKLVDEYERVFKTKTKMLVFDYETGTEKEVEMTPYDSVKFHNQHLQAGMLAVDPHNGYIKAWVGGINHKYFKYDHVTSRRQVGSTIKPFVYGTAISLQGFSPCKQFEDIQYTIAPGDGTFDMETEWSPANANEKFTGNMYNLYQGLLYSKNSITVRLVKEMGSVNVIRELLSNTGIDTKMRHPNGALVVPRLPSICLGAIDLTLKEMTGAYTTFANNGTYTEPIFLNRIEDKNGKVIYTGAASSNKAINPLYNSVMVDMLKNNVGSGFSLGIKSKAGGKTGTTNDYCDGWFMGITPNLVVGTWVGGDDKWIRFLTLDDGQGFVMARPVFQKFMKGVEGDPAINFDTKADFLPPPDGFSDFIDCAKYKQKKVEDEQAEILDAKTFNDEFDEEEEDFDEEEMEEEEEDF